MVELSQAFTIYHVPVTSYKAILDALPQHRLRHAYVDHVLEMVPDDYWRERVTKVIGRFIETLVFQLDVEITSFGATTLWHDTAALGFEPDASYYFSPRRVLGGHPDGSSNRKPPDLILDVYGDVGRVDRLELCRKLRIPEVWRYRDGTVGMFLLDPSSGYSPISNSTWLPMVTGHNVTRFVNMLDERDENSVVRAFVDASRKGERGDALIDSD